MTVKTLLFIFLISFLSKNLAIAKTIGYSHSQSSSSSTISFNYDWDDESYDGSLNYSASSSNVTDSTTGSAYTSTTNTYEFDSLWTTETKYYFGFDLGYSIQKENNITSFAPTFKLAKKFYFQNSNNKKKTNKKADGLEGEDSGESNSDFKPTMKPSFSFGSNNMNVNVATKKAKAKLNLTQSYYKIGAIYNPFESWSFNLYYKKYTYNKDVNTFLSQLDSPILTRLGTGNAANGFGTFYDSVSSASVTYTLIEDVDLEFNYSFSRDSTSSTTYTDNGISIDWTISKNWEISAEYSQSSSSSSTDKSDYYQSSLSYNF